MKIVIVPDSYKESLSALEVVCTNVFQGGRLIAWKRIGANVAFGPKDIDKALLAVGLDADLNVYDACRMCDEAYVDKKALELRGMLRNFKGKSSHK